MKVGIADEPAPANGGTHSTAAAPNVSADTVSGLISESHRLLLEGQIGSALAVYSQVLKAEPTNATALHQVGYIHLKQGDYERAADFIGGSLVYDPCNPVFHINLGEAYRNLGQLRRALGCCRVALGFRPDFPDGILTLGRVLLDLRQYEEAADEFRRVLVLDPDMAAAHNNLGLALRELARMEEAISHFRRAAELYPHSVHILTNLGLALLANREPELALPHFAQAIQGEPDSAVSHFNFGCALRELGRLNEARAAYLEAVRLEPGWAAARCQVALTLWREGQLKEALAWYDQAGTLEPNDYSILEPIAEIHQELDNLEKAIECWELALSRFPEARVPVHLGLGSALRDDGRLADAMDHFQAALNLDPASAPALLNIGNLYETTGDMAKAEHAYREALVRQPGNPIPIARLAVLLRSKLPECDLTKLDEHLGEDSLALNHRCRLLFALAHVLDSRGHYARAADCLRDANGLVMTGARRHLQYRPDDHSRFMDRLRASFDEQLVSRLAACGLDSPCPIFVFGLPRSGTTLVEQILCSHPLVHGAGELRLARGSFQSIPFVLGCAELPLECFHRLDEGALRTIAQRHLDKLISLSPGGSERIVDKMPDNYIHFGLLRCMFPNAVFIHCRRDLRDVAVSCWMTDFAKIRWANHFEHIASRFTEYENTMRHWERLHPAQFHEVVYEDVVENLEEVAREVVALCGLEWHDRCLEFYNTARPVRTASITQVRQPIYTSSVGRWRNYKSELAELFEMLPQQVDREPLKLDSRG